MRASARPRPAAAVLLAAGVAMASTSCGILPHGPPQGMRPLYAVGGGVASGLSGEHARTGVTITGYDAGTSRWGSYLKLRVDVLEFFTLGAALDDGDDDDLDEDGDGVLLDDYEGALVADVGVVYRVNDDVAFFVGIGAGNFYERRTVRDDEGRKESSLRTLFWDQNLAVGVLWLPESGLGVEFGYDTFDESWRLGIVTQQWGARRRGGLHWSDRY